ncbi:MAG: CoB--CoM heterodisulfide reductase iron-sulfur subunit A family protein, partial [Deltaproteobacteria bacterium]|nr:CoB--CoM heterodisulfide reductase iron-sulfur subunit A family protein [Deltaproteobacteria bacterium]
MPPARASAAVDAPRASGAVLVVGAGVAGLSAALELAELGCRVVLTDASPAIGGLLARLDRQFPSDHCGMCRLLPDIGREEAAQLCLRKGLFHERIEVLPATRVEAVHGEPGAFAVQLVGEPRFVDPARCTGCGDRCAEVCPVEVPDDFSGWPAARRKAIHRPVPHALPNVHRIIAEFCTRCGQCAAICPAGAIDLQAAPVQRTVRAEAIVLAAGLGLFDPAADPAMERFLVSPNVVTALQLERLLGGRGRRPGPLRRPSDGRPVRRVAWLQCVGSRAAKQGRDHCSSVCCMFALKEAVLARQQCGPELEATIFAMDLRTYGKGHHRYRVRAEQEHGVRIVRCRPHEVVALADGSLRVRFADPATGELGQQTFDLVVLSTGQAAPRPDAAL